jgi:hypothetical protein
MQGLTDTPPEIAEMVRARLMALPGAERFLMGVRMFEAARRMALALLPADLPEPERKRLLFERSHGAPLPIASHASAMKITEDARKYAAEQAISEEDALKKCIEEKSEEFVAKGAEVYAKA